MDSRFRIRMALLLQRYESLSYYVLNLSLVFLALFSATNIILATIQLFKFHRFYGGCIQSMALYVLLLEITGNTIRLLLCVDPFGSRYIYTDIVQTVFLQSWIPLFIASLLLFVLYWHELMTNASIIVHPFITRMKVPFLSSPRVWWQSIY